MRPKFQNNKHLLPVVVAGLLFIVLFSMLLGRGVFIDFFHYITVEIQPEIQSATDNEKSKTGEDVYSHKIQPPTPPRTEEPKDKIRVETIEIPKSSATTTIQASSVYDEWLSNCFRNELNKTDRTRNLAGLTIIIKNTVMEDPTYNGSSGINSTKHVALTADISAIYKNMSIDLKTKKVEKTLRNIIESKQSACLELADSAIDNIMQKIR